MKAGEWVSVCVNMCVSYAGNDGRRHAVGDPATAKNALAVGATLSSRSALEAYGADRTGLPADTESVLASYSSQGPTADFR